MFLEHSFVHLPTLVTKEVTVVHLQLNVLQNMVLKRGVWFLQICGWIFDVSLALVIVINLRLSKIFGILVPPSLIFVLAPEKTIEIGHWFIVNYLRRFSSKFSSKKSYYRQEVGALIRAKIIGGNSLKP